MILRFMDSGPEQFSIAIEGSNPTSTPWMGDLDGDGKIDIIYVYQNDIYNESIVSGFHISRISTKYNLNRKIVWGSYMGSNYDGVYQKNR